MIILISLFQHLLITTLKHFYHSSWLTTGLVYISNNSKTIDRIELWLVSKEAPFIGAHFDVRLHCCQIFLSDQHCQLQFDPLLNNLHFLHWHYIEFSHGIFNISCKFQMFNASSWCINMERFLKMAFLGASRTVPYLTQKWR